MYYRDHGPPHFHAIYGEYEALLKLDDLVVFCRVVYLKGH
ncbi:MAG: DUF4160 domain-containing protein [Gammaproteobacteria bacterium]|nr:DUF4160 domain-containing protein [Gammaproteobacteria bacterium]